MKKQDY